MKYLVEHKLPKGCTRSDIENMTKSAQTDPNVKGYRSFLNLSDCKGYCIFDASDKTTLVNWLKTNNMSYDSITDIELEGYEGKFTETLTPVGTGV